MIVMTIFTCTVHDSADLYIMTRHSISSTMSLYAMKSASCVYGYVSCVYNSQFTEYVLVVVRMQYCSLV